MGQNVGSNQQGNNLWWLTGLTVAPSGTPDVAGMIYTTDIGNVHGKTANKNDQKREIIQIAPDGAQTLLISQTNDFTIPITNGMITNLFHPTGIDVNPINGHLFIADSFSKTIWELGRDVGDGANGSNADLKAHSIDGDFLQPVHLAVDRTGTFIYMTDGETVGPPSAYPVDTRLIHRITIGDPPESNSLIFNQNGGAVVQGILEEPRGIEIIPVDPLTGN